MKYGVDLSQPSTVRGLVWVIVSIAGLLLIMSGRSSEIPQLMVLAAGVSGGLGVAIKD